jgi:hypothetical protein
MHLRIPSPATVMSAIALVASLSTGGAYAATQLKANSVGSAQIKPRSVQTSDLALNARVSKSNRVFRAAVTDTLLDPSTQAVVDALSGAVRGEKGDRGDAGPAGAAGATGAAGQPSIQHVTVRIADGDTTAPVIARCEAGEQAIGGGGSGFPADVVVIQSSAPNYPDSTAWQVTGGSLDNQTRSVRAYAICAQVNA